MEYVRSAFPTALQLWGPDEAAHSLQMSSRMVGMQFHHQTAQGLGGAYDKSPLGFAKFIADLGAAHGDKTGIVKAGDGFIVEQTGWTFMAGITETHPNMARAWNGLIEGALIAHNRRLQMNFEASAGAYPVLRWRISQ